MIHHALFQAPDLDRLVLSASEVNAHILKHGPFLAFPTHPHALNIVLIGAGGEKHLRCLSITPLSSIWAMVVNASRLWADLWMCLMPFQLLGALRGDTEAGGSGTLLRPVAGGSWYYPSGDWSRD